jgi:exopolysaccharide biosynthesis protein
MEEREALNRSMKTFFTKPYRWAVIFSLLLIGSFVLILLDTFVIPKSLTTVMTKPAIAIQTSSQSVSDPAVTDYSYEDDNMKITIDTVRKYDSTIYVADIQLADAAYLKTALAGNVYGRNIKDTTSQMAESNHAIFAVNGDYYGFRDAGYVLRNGVSYRNSARNAGDDEALVINEEGGFSIIHESQTNLGSLGNGIWQIFSFGPALVENDQIVVDSTSEVSRAMRSNPRTAIGQIDKLHYIIIVADGRTTESEGLSLFELAQEFADRGCTTAYNLDGGGSSTMYFNGNIINNPTDGRGTSEREVSDIVYLGY